MPNNRCSSGWVPPPQKRMKPYETINTHQHSSTSISHDRSSFPWNSSTSSTISSDQLNNKGSLCIHLEILTDPGGVRCPTTSSLHSNNSTERPLNESRSSYCRAAENVLHSDHQRPWDHGIYVITTEINDLTHIMHLDHWFTCLAGLLY